LNFLVNAKEYQFDAKKIVDKLRSIQRLEKKEKGLEVDAKYSQSKQQSTKTYCH
jgi:hypothetical protein